MNGLSSFGLMQLAGVEPATYGSVGSQLAIPKPAGYRMESLDTHRLSITTASDSAALNFPDFTGFHRVLQGFGDKR
jgi:hypothetical protein